MRKLKIALWLACGMLGVFSLQSCNPESTKAEDVLNVDVDSLHFQFTGASEEEGKLVKVESSTEWRVTSNETWLKVDSLDETTFIVTADYNDGNERKATISVITDADTKSIEVTQEENLGLELTEITANKYHLDFYDRGMGNYAFNLKGLDESGNGYEIEVDMLSDLVFARGEVPLPVGNYVYGNTYEKYVVSNECMILIYEGGTLVAAGIASEGKMDISLDGDEYTIKFNITLDNAESTQIKAYYRGPFAADVVEEWILSGLYEDLDAGTLETSINYTYFPNAFEDNSADAYTISMKTSDIVVGEVLSGTGWYIMTQISAPLNSGNAIPEGVYTISHAVSVGTAFHGLFGSSGTSGTWIRELNNDELVTYAPLKLGTITISKSGEIYTFDIDAIDDAGNSIKAIATGSVEEISNTPNKFMPLSNSSKSLLETATFKAK